MCDVLIYFILFYVFVLSYELSIKRFRFKVVYTAWALLQLPPQIRTGIA